MENMVSKRQGIITSFFGVSVSLINAIVQFLTIYFILLKYGSSFNGFVRLSSTFSFILSTSDSALGIATTLLLVKPLAENDWITANEIYSSSKKSYRKGAIIGFVGALSISIVYALFISLQSGNATTKDIFTNFKVSDLKLTGTDQSFSSISIFVLFGISFIYSTRYLISNLFFNAYENLLNASNKGAVVKISILISELLCFSLILLMLNQKGVSIIFVFTPIIFASSIRGLLVFLYTKRQFSYLHSVQVKKNKQLNTLANKISMIDIGKQLILNTDILIVTLLIGLRISSTLSLYLVVAVNTKLIMKNFIISFRNYFINFISKYGRLKWQSYCKYELYSTIIAIFTFINLAILSPYFVGAFYGNNIISENVANTNSKGIDYILFSPVFSFIYAACSAMELLSDSKSVLINSKSINKNVSKVQQVIGILYLISTISTAIYFSQYKDMSKEAIQGMYIIKFISLLSIYLYLYSYVKKYLTYNSALKDSINNMLYLIISMVICFFIQRYICISFMPIKEYSISSNQITPKLWKLIILFVFTILGSVFYLIVSSFALFPRIMASIFMSLPVIKLISELRQENAREERINKFQVELLDFDESVITSKPNHDEVKEENKKMVYTIKG